MKRCLTGLKPTGDLTLGNYIGSIKQMVKNQEKYDNFLFIADLHALTTYQEPEVLRKRIKEFLALYFACGIDPKLNTIYIQSENEYIPSISWLLECVTPFGEASRMIQFKEKSKENSNFSVGLLTYPILMAADILYCDSIYVPVGIDQKQHVELARNIAEHFNKKYGDTFVLPEPLIKEEGTKIKDLKDPLKKMSKSEDSPMGVITLLDTKEEIETKIKKCTTDSIGIVKYDEENQPGISNLLNIVSSLEDVEIKKIEEMFIGKGYGEFKTYVSDIISKHILEIQEKYKYYLNNPILDKVLEEGILKSRSLAKEKYELMKKKMGL